MIFDILKRLISEQFAVDEDELTPETDFYDHLSADSLDMVELALACEEEFDISIPDDEAVWSVTTIGGLVGYIESNMD